MAGFRADAIHRFAVHDPEGEVDIPETQAAPSSAAGQCASW